MKLSADGSLLRVRVRVRVKIGVRVRVRVRVRVKARVRIRVGVRVRVRLRVVGLGLGLGLVESWHLQPPTGKTHVPMDPCVAGVVACSQKDADRAAERGGEERL